MVARTWRPYVVASALGALTATIGALSPAAASPLTEACGASGGMFTAGDCTCLDGKVAAEPERVDLTAYFQANANEVKGGPTPNENDPQMKRGFEALNKYLAQCLK